MSAAQTMPTHQRSPAMMPSVAQAQPVARIQPRGQQVAPEAAMPNISVGFGNLASFEFTQRVARALAASTLVPEQYRMLVPKGKFGPAREQMIENPNAIPNCIIALNMAQRIGADPLMVMQNLYIVEGRPSWSAQFVISAINSCGRFTALKFRVTKGEVRTMDYTVQVWDDNARAKVTQTKKATFRDMSCVAYTTEKATGEVLESPEITMEMAVLEGWFGRNGSKWQTIPDLMIRYRSASFFGRLNAPEILMGIRTEDENREIIEAEREADGSWGVPRDPEAGVIMQDLDDVQSTAEEVAQDGAAVAQVTHETTQDPVTAGLAQVADRDGVLVDQGQDQGPEPAQAQTRQPEEAKAATSGRRAPLSASMPGGQLPLGGDGFGDVE